MPLSVAITAQDAMQRLGPAFSETSLAHFAPLSLALHLMIESLNPSSSLRPYIDVLPSHEELQGALTFGDDALRALTLSPAIASILNLIKNIARAYVNIFDLVATGSIPGLTAVGACVRCGCVLFAVLFADGTSTVTCGCHTDYTWARFRWAMGVVLGREMNVQLPSGEHVSALVPFWDMLNMEPGGVELTQGATLNLGISALKAVDAGDEVRGTHTHGRACAPHVHMRVVHPPTMA